MQPATCNTILQRDTSHIYNISCQCISMISGKFICLYYLIYCLTICMSMSLDVLIFMYIVCVFYTNLCQAELKSSRYANKSLTICRRSDMRGARTGFWCRATKSRCLKSPILVAFYERSACFGTFWVRCMFHEHADLCAARVRAPMPWRGYQFVYIYKEQRARYCMGSA